MRLQSTRGCVIIGVNESLISQVQVSEE
jgi:hypothetical protein